MPRASAQTMCARLMWVQVLGEARMARVMFTVHIHGVCSIDYPSCDVPAVPSSLTSVSIAKERRPHISLI